MPLDPNQQPVCCEVLEDVLPMTDVDLSQISYFADLPPAALARVAAAAHQRQYQAGAMIFNEGERCAGFYVVADGLVRIYRVGQEARLHTLSLLRPMSTFNEVSAVDGGPNPFYATAVTDVTVVVIHRERLLRLHANGDIRVLVDPTAFRGLGAVALAVAHLLARRNLRQVVVALEPGG